MSAALLRLPGRALGRVDVYRDGRAVVVVGNVEHKAENPGGHVHTRVEVSTRFETIAAFNHAKRCAVERSPLAYMKLREVLHVDDDARNAPPLPERLRARLGLPPASAVRAYALPALVAGYPEDDNG
jgi:hypothetical protein